MPRVPGLSSVRWTQAFSPVSCLVEKRQIEGEAREILERLGEIPVYTAEMEVLAQITGFKLTRGMLCAMYRKPLPSVEEVIRDAKRIAILENVVNPTNVGAFSVLRRPSIWMRCY